MDDGAIRHFLALKELMLYSEGDISRAVIVSVSWDNSSWWKLAPHAEKPSWAFIFDWNSPPEYYKESYWTNRKYITAAMLNPGEVQVHYGPKYFTRTIAMPLPEDTGSDIWPDSAKNPLQCMMKLQNSNPERWEYDITGGIRDYISWKAISRLYTGCVGIEAASSVGMSGEYEFPDWANCSFIKAKRYSQNDIMEVRKTFNDWGDYEAERNFAAAVNFVENVKVLPQYDPQSDSLIIKFVPNDITDTIVIPGASSLIGNHTGEENSKKDSVNRIIASALDLLALERVCSPERAADYDYFFDTAFSALISAADELIEKIKDC